MSIIIIIIISVYEPVNVYIGIYTFITILKPVKTQ